MVFHQSRSPVYSPRRDVPCRRCLSQPTTSSHGLAPSESHMVSLPPSLAGLVVNEPFVWRGALGAIYRAPRELSVYHAAPGAIPQPMRAAQIAFRIATSVVSLCPSPPVSSRLVSTVNNLPSGFFSCLLSVDSNPNNWSVAHLLRLVWDFVLYLVLSHCALIVRTDCRLSQRCDSTVSGRLTECVLQRGHSQAYYVLHVLASCSLRH